MPTYTHESLKIEIAKGRDGKSRKFANNTYIQYRDNGDIAIKLHETDIITFHNGVSITLSSGGYATMITNERINTFLRGYGCVISDKGRWFLVSGSNKYRFFDGMYLKIKSNDTLELMSSDATYKAVLARDTTDAKTLAKIEKYVALYTSEELERLFQKGASGDCWYCSMFPQKDSEHLFQHMKEKYTMLTLLYNAYKEKGYTNPYYVIQLDARHSDARLQSTLKKYLKKHCYVGITAVR